MTSILTKEALNQIEDIAAELEKQKVDSENFFKLDRNNEQHALLKEIGFTGFGFTLMQSSLEERQRATAQIRKLIESAKKNRRLSFIPKIIINQRRNEDEKRAKAVKAFIKSFDMSLFERISSNGFKFDELPTLREVEKTFREYGLNILQQDTPMNSTQGGSYAELLEEAILSCKQWLKDIEAQEEKQKRIAEEVEEKQRQEEIKTNKVIANFIQGLESDSFNTTDLSEGDQKIIEKFLVHKGMGHLPLNAISEMTLFQKIIFVEALKSHRTDEVETKRHDNQNDINALLSECLKNPNILLGLAKRGENPREVWDFINNDIIKPKLGIEPSENSVFELLKFLQGPITDDIADVLAVIIEALVNLQENEKLKEAIKKQKIQAARGYKESLDIIQDAGFSQEEALQILRTEISSRYNWMKGIQGLSKK